MIRRGRRATSSFLVIMGHGAGGAKWQNEHAIISRFFEERHIPCEIVTIRRSTNQIETQRDIEEKIRASGAERILVAGGDGTVRSVTECVFRMGINRSIGILPVGSANVLARVLNIPLSLKDALSFAVKAKPRSMTLGVLDDRHVFLLSACYGQLAQVSIDADVYFKQTVGFWAYVAAGARNLLAFPRTLVSLRRPVPNTGESMLAHSTLFFLRTPAQALVPSLNVNSDGLHALVFHNLTIFGFVRTLWDLYLLQSKSTKHMTHLSSADTVEIEAHPSWNLHLDGDFIPQEPGQKTHSMTVVKNAVTFLC